MKGKLLVGVTFEGNMGAVGMSEATPQDHEIDDVNEHLWGLYDERAVNFYVVELELPTLLEAKQVKASAVTFSG